MCPNCGLDTVETITGEPFEVNGEWFYEEYEYCSACGWTGNSALIPV